MKIEAGGALNHRKSAAGTRIAQTQPPTRLRPERTRKKSDLSGIRRTPRCQRPRNRPEAAAAIMNGTGEAVEARRFEVHGIAATPRSGREGEKNQPIRERSFEETKRQRRRLRARPMVAMAIK